MCAYLMFSLSLSLITSVCKANLSNLDVPIEYHRQTDTFKNEMINDETKNLRQRKLIFSPLKTNEWVNIHQSEANGLLRFHHLNLNDLIVFGFFFLFLICQVSLVFHSSSILFLLLTSLFLWLFNYSLVSFSSFNSLLSTSSSRIELG